MSCSAQARSVVTKGGRRVGCVETLVGLFVLRRSHHSQGCGDPTLLTLLAGIETAVVRYRSLDEYST